MSNAPKKMQTPSRGQPVDAAFLYELTDNVNRVIETYAERKGYVSVQGDPKKAVSKKSTPNSSIHASVVKVEPQSGEVNASMTIPVKISFSGITFAEPPVVTATPIVVGEVTEASKNVTVTLSSLTVAEVYANVTFGTQGTVKDLYLHVIAIGHAA
jgi:hypothetical protein